MAAWHTSFITYVQNLGEVASADKLNLLVNHVDAAVYELFVEASTYDEAIASLKAVYAKPQNYVFARYLLRSRKQVSEEHLDEYLQNVKRVSVDCEFEEVSAAQHKEEAIRDALIGGLQSKEIRQRLIEEKDPTLKDTVDKALSLEAAQKKTQRISIVLCVATKTLFKRLLLLQLEVMKSYSKTSNRRTQLPQQVNVHIVETNVMNVLDALLRTNFASNVKKGHFSKVCRSQSVKFKSSCASSLLTEIKPESTGSVSSKLNTPVEINEVKANALIDPRSTSSHLSERFVKILDLKKRISTHIVGLAVKGVTSESLCMTTISVKFNGTVYGNFRVTILKDLLTDIILCQDFMQLHQNVDIHFGGPRPTLHLGALEADVIGTAVKLFTNLTEGCRPVATPERKYLKADKTFISNEVKRLLSDGLIEPSNSPWRAQPVVVAKRKSSKANGYPLQSNKQPFHST